MMVVLVSRRCIDGLNKSKITKLDLDFRTPRGSSSDLTSRKTLFPGNEFIFSVLYFIILLSNHRQQAILYLYLLGREANIPDVAMQGTHQQHHHYHHKRRRHLATATLAAATVAVLGIGPQFSHAFSSSATSTSLKNQHSKIIGNDCKIFRPARPNLLSALFAKARRSGGGASNKKSLNRKKKAESNSRKGALLKSNKSKKGDGKSKKAAPAVSAAVSPAPSSPSASSGQRAPPWQVLSQKDAKKNIQREKKRREAISKGEAATSVTSAQLIYDNDEDDDFEAPMQVSTSFMDPADKAFFGWKRFNPSTVSMRYVASVLDRQPLPRLGVPEIAFLGRYVVLLFFCKK